MPAANAATSPNRRAFWLPTWRRKPDCAEVPTKQLSGQHSSFNQWRVALDLAIDDSA